jgi:general stress protein YciG
MSGTKSGGLAAAKTNKTKYGPDFYAKIGSKGGKLGTGGGFAAGKEGRERASYYGRIGGSRSRRTAKAAS